MVLFGRIAFGLAAVFFVVMVIIEVARQNMAVIQYWRAKTDKACRRQPEQPSGCSLEPGANNWLGAGPLIDARPKVANQRAGSCEPINNHLSSLARPPEATRRVQSH